MEKDDEAKDALVENAADEEQVKDSVRKEKLIREGEIADLKKILDTHEGKRFVFRLLEFCSPHQSPFAVDDRVTHMNIGRQDVGRFLYAEISSVDPESLTKLMMESKKGKE